MTKADWITASIGITVFILIELVVLNLETDLDRWVFALTFAGRNFCFGRCQRDQAAPQI